AAKVNVVQPSSQSVLLNRVLSDNPTQIFGQLNANGQVVLVNPRGIVVGSDGSVNTAGFTASALNISDADFMQGRYRYVGDGSNGEVLNQGTIRTAPGGYVALLGARVSNEGQIIAPQGRVALGAADRISVPLGSTGKIKLELSPASINASVANRKGGVIVAEGGQVYLQASAVAGALALASVQQSGQIDTSGAQAGDVHLLADNGRIVVDGQIKANSSDATAKGGSIVIGRDVDSGALAASTDVSAATLESQKGFVETSGQHLVVDGIQVKAGEWLLDPTDITIGAAATSGIASSGTNPITQNPNTTGTTASTISATTLASTLSGGTSVVVKTTNASGTANGDITVASNIAVTGAADATLTLQAERDIVVNAGVSIARTGSNKLNVVFNSDLDGSGAGAIVMNTGSAITSNGGKINLGGGTAGDASGYARGYSARPNGVELISTTINAGGGNISINGQGGTSSTASGRGVVMTNSTVSTTGAGSMAAFGIGGASTNTPASFALGHNNGVLLDGGSVTGGSSGSTWIWGQGGAGALAYNYGVSVTNSATVTSTGGIVTVQGTGGGSGSSDRNIGVQISQSAQVTSSGGNVNVDGTGGNTTGGLNAGVAVVDGGKVTASGTNTLTVTATGGGNSSTSGGDNMGLWMAGTGTGAPLIQSASGNISITGAAGGATTSAGRNGISLTGDSKINSTAAQVTLTTDSINLVDSSLVSANTTSGTVTIQNKTAGTLINVGGTAADAWASVPNTLAVSQAELGKISAATTVIGRNDATGSGNLTVTGAVNMGTMGNPNGNLTLLSGNNITVNSSTGISKTAGTADATVKLLANHEIVVNSNMTASGTGVGKLNILLNSDADGSGAGAIVVSNAASINSNGGNITMGGGAAGDGLGNARGYTSANNGNRAAGILLNGVSVSAGGGNIAMNGQGSATTTSTNYGDFQAMGVRIIGSTVATTGAGNIAILGEGGNGSDTNAGVAIDQLTGTASNVAGSTTGTVTITGTGGAGTASVNNNYNFGTWMAGGSRVTTTGGSVNVTGTGTGQGSNRANVGVMVQNNANLGATGAGTVTITGVGGNSNAGGSTERNNGVDIFNNGSVTSVSGAINITGTNTSTTNPAFGIALTTAGSGGGKISSSGNAPITLNTDTLSMDSSTSATINAGTGTVTIQNKTAGTNINVGGADVQTVGSETLGVSNAELKNITAGNVVIGKANAGGLTVSSNVTTNAAMGNLTLLTPGNIAVNAVLNVGDDPATAGTVEASKNLTLNASGATSTVTDGASGAIKATGLELLGATAAYTLDSTANSVSTLAGSTGSVTLVDSTALLVGTVNTINSANTVTGTVGLTTTGNISLTGSTTAASTDGLRVSQLVNSTGSGSITLSGTATGVSSGQGVYLGANVTANTGAINVTGLSSATSPVGTGVYVGSAVSSKGAISLTGTGKNIGVNIDTPGSVISLANGSNFAGADAISITGTANGTSPFAGVLLRNVVNNNSSNGATTIKSLSGNVRVQAGTSITNASSAGAINIAAGDGTTASTASIVYDYTSGTVPQITQNANADVVLTTDGQGDLSSPKIVKSGTGAGDIVLAAGKLLAAGVATGGQVKPVAGNSVTNSGTGHLYVYSGSPTSANTAAMSSLDASLANLYLSAVGANVQNADANVAYGSTIASGPKAQVMFRSKVDVGTLNGATVSKTYGDANTGNTDVAALWTDMLAALNTANTTSGVSNVNSTSTTAGTLKITDTAIINSLAASTLQSTAYSTAQKLKANTSGYTYSAPVSSKYTTALTSGQSAIVTVALKALTPSVTANNKVYNDSTTATLTTKTVSGVVSGDAVNLDSTGATFDTQHVGTGKTVTATGLSLSGTDAANYSLPGTSTTTTANVTAKALTLAAVTDTKIYDGTTSSGATVTVTGLEGNDTASVSQAFTNKNVLGANGSTLQVNSGYTINDGNSGNNYSVSTSTATGTINKANLALSGSRTYDAGKTFAGQYLTATGVNGETFTLTGLGDASNLASKNVQTNQALSSVTGLALGTSANGGISDNYNAISTTGSSVSVTPKSATVSATATTKTYSGLTQSQDAATSSGFIGTDAITISGASSGKNAGTYSSNMAVSGNDAGNYSVSITNADLTIAKANLTVAMSDQTKVYDGTRMAALASGAITATGVTVNGVAETATVSQTAGTYNTKDVATANLVTANLASADFTAVGATDLNNYNLPTTVTGTGSITAKSVTYAGLTVNNKTYDRSTSASLGGTATLGTVAAGSSLSTDAKVIATDSVSLSGTAAGTYASKDVTATNNTVTFSGLSLSGGDAGNYTLVQQASVNGTGTITAKTLTATVQANDKTYDGTANATLKTVNGMSSADVISGDSVTFSNSSASFADRHVAKDGNGNVVGKTVTVSGLAIDGTDASNYALASTSATTTAMITPKALTLAAGTDSKTYDGTTNSNVAVTADALESMDTFTASQAFASKDVMGSNGSTLQVNSGYTISDGNSGNNYTVSTSTATGTISKAALTVTANADAKFVTQADATGYNGVSYSGLVNGETSAVLGGTLSVTRTNASTNVGAGTYAGTLVASGLTSGNYTISYDNGDYTIVPANQLLIRTNNVSTVYGTAPTYSTTAQYLDGSNVIHTLSQSGTGNSFTFSDGAGGSVATVLKPYSGAAVASQSSTGHTVVGAYAIKDATAIVTGSNFVGAPVYVGNLTVTPKAVSTSAAGVSKVYDGTTAMGNATLSLSGQLMGDQLGVSGTGAFSQKNVGTDLSYAFNNLALTGTDRGNYYLSGGNNLTGTNGVITPAPLTIAGTQALDKNYDGTTFAGVIKGSMLGLIGNETLSMASVDGQFDTAEPGQEKNVTVIYNLANGTNGGLASNYIWSPVITTAQIFSPAKDQRYEPVLTAVADAYSRVSYLGFNAKTGGAVAGTSRVPWLADNSACTPSRIEECICEQAEDQSVEICVAPTRATAE
ncbi:MAG: Heme/hemopexin-binding protein precursor, partial [Pseudomonadota bacterium]